MKKLWKIIFATIIFISLFSFAKADLNDYTILRDIDKWTFNEYRYYLVKEYFKLKSSYEVSWTMDISILNGILKYAKTWYNYLPDSLINQNLYNDLNISLQKAYKSPNSEVYYEEVVSKINDFIDKKISIQKIKWTIEASPQTWNAPLTVTLRSQNIVDPTWSIIPTTNYVWWIDDSWKKRVVWKGVSINYTFLEEWQYTVFLDVESSHKNKAWYTDVIPFSSRADIIVKAKIASLIVTINWYSLKNIDEIKFSPEESSYWLLIDATSSTPTWSTKFLKTEWDFGNWVKKSYEGSPKIERVIYSREWEYNVSLKLTTNEAKTVIKNFKVLIHKPIATIVTAKEDWFIWDRFDFSPKSSVSDKNLSYNWKIIDTENDKVIFSKSQNTINYVFNKKWKFNIQLQVKDSAWNVDTDTKIIYINSRAPVANFIFSIKDNSKPNRVYLDWTKSYDLDITDQWKLQYEWTIDWEKVQLENPTANGWIGYYTFNNIGDHSISLEVIDSDKISSIKEQKITINSILSVELFTFPKIIQRWYSMRINAISPNANIFEWNFWDGNSENSRNNKITHKFEKSGTYKVKLTVKDKDWNSNQATKEVYVWDSNSPFADIVLSYGNSEFPEYSENECKWWAYIVDRTKIINFSWKESINIDWTTSWLTYTWKVGNSKFLNWSDITQKFDELGCFPVKLTIKSDKNWATSSKEVWLKVNNLKPVLAWINWSVKDMTTDPVIVNLQAVWASDPDWVIQSYLWYYYTDSDLDPQDYRITTLPNTTFVLPKISWTYNFILVLRDNNNSEYSSKENESNSYSLPLAWDNINTPLINLWVDKNNIFIWDEVNFSAEVKNVLWEDISAKSEYAWDFDGDWFYDKESKTKNISYTYNKSWTFYAKLRVKHKWMTNVSSVEIVVSNILKPEFEYISIWNKYLFFNTSKWKLDSLTWDLGDWNQINDKEYFEYIYTDSKRNHKVSLNITEWTNSKTSSQEVVMSAKNLIKLRNADWLVIFSYPEVVNDKVTLDENNKKFVLYIPYDADINNYSLDSDIFVDSDLNWEKDDDIDNKLDWSYKNGWFIIVPLNDFKNQKIRLFLQDITWKTIHTKDIEIIKDYIEEKNIDISSLTFSWVTDSEKLKIEKIKSFVSNLPQKDRLKWMEFVTKLQAEWFYENEKTKIILDFIEYIDSLKLSNWEEIISLLESFLVEWQSDKSTRNKAYNVIKWLIPKEIVWYDSIISNLDIIKNNENKLEENILLWRDILDSIKDTSLINNEDKIIIKTSLQVLIYWDISKIPQEIKNDVKKDDGYWSWVFSLLSWTLKTIWLWIALLIIIVVWFFIWFKISNKNKNIGLQDFIIEKTNNIKDNNKDDDILWNISSFDKKEDILKKDEVKKEDILKNNIKKEPIPDWLAKASENQNEIPKKEEVKNDVISEKTNAEKIKKDETTKKDEIKKI